MTDDNEAFLARLRREGGAQRLLPCKPGSAADADATAALAAELGAAWVVCDGYHFDAAYQARLKAAGPRLLFVDDYGHCEQYCADLVLNQNLYAEPSPYALRAPECDLLLGSRYALLRKEFTSISRGHRTVPPRAHHLLVTLGGADPADFTSTALAALARSHQELQALVVVGGSNPRGAEIEREARAIGGRVTVVRAVDDMPTRMAWADLAVTAGGSTCWELMYMGVPALVVVLADNQVRVAEAVERHGAGVNLGHCETLDAKRLGRALGALLADPSARGAMVRAGQTLVDGRGAERVVDAMLAQG